MYVSNDPIWPYDTEDGEAKAVSNCQRMGLPLASDIDQEEKDALQQLTRKLTTIMKYISNTFLVLGCQMQVPEGRGILVKQKVIVASFKNMMEVRKIVVTKIVLKTHWMQVKIMHLFTMLVTRIPNVVSPLQI